MKKEGVNSDAPKEPALVEDNILAILTQRMKDLKLLMNEEEKKLQVIDKEIKKLANLMRAKLPTDEIKHLHEEFEDIFFLQEDKKPADIYNIFSVSDESPASSPSFKRRRISPSVPDERESNQVVQANNPNAFYFKKQPSTKEKEVKDKQDTIQLNW